MVSKQIGISDALFGKGRQRVLAVLFGDPDRRLYVRQIERMAGTGLGSVQRELARLAAAGLVNREQEGHQTYYRANRQCPVFPELRDLVRKTSGAVDQLRAALAPLGSRVAVAAIFGSFASGTERSNSDVDLLVIGSATFREVVDAMSDVESGLGRPVNPVVYSEHEYANGLRHGKHFPRALLRGPKVFIVGGENDLAAMAGERVVDEP